jgi:hypothetical protein
MMIPRLWKKLQGEKNAYMIRKKESLLSKNFGKTRGSLRGSRGRRGTSHHFSEIVLKKTNFERARDG